MKLASHVRLYYGRMMSQLCTCVLVFILRLHKVLDIYIIHNKFCYSWFLNLKLNKNWNKASIFYGPSNILHGPQVVHGSTFGDHCFGLQCWSDTEDTQCDKGMSHQIDALKNMEAKKTLIIKIRKRNLKLLRNILRKGGLENLALKGRIKVNRCSNKPSDQYT